MKVTEKKSPLKKFKILSDEPLFKEGYQAEADAFHHEAYANTIYELLLNNEPPLSIGLFGSWGIGKSTVINILLDKIKKEHFHNFMPVYFNAWKYSGDSFRMQFLLTVAQKILLNKEKEEVINRIKTLFHKEILKEAQKPIIESVKEHYIHFKKEPLRFLKLVLSSIVIALLVFALIKIQIPAPFIAILTALFIFLLTKTIPNILQVNIPLETDPQLVLPKQFEDKFKEILNIEEHKHLKGKKILIVIDDFDRCHPEMIYDIFTSIKTFLKHERCFFLVALDDKSVIEVLKKKTPGYEKEELRKYFDVALRMTPLEKLDLVDFANTVARKTDIPDSVIQIAILAGYDNARKMKHFINTFVMKYGIAKEREWSGYIPFDVDDHFNELAKIVVLETHYPEIVERIIRDPQFLEKLEKQALESNPGNENDMKKYLKYPGLREFLEGTRNVKIDNPELFSILKISNIEMRLPKGSELKYAILNNQEEKIEKILEEIKIEETENDIVDLLIDMLNRTTAIFLQNTTESALNLINKEDFLSDKNRKRLSQEVCNNFLIPNAELSIFTQNINYLFNCANIAGNYCLKELAKKSIPEINLEDKINNKIIDVLNNLYKFKLLIGESSWIEIINSKMDAWYVIALKEKKENEYLEFIDKLYALKKKETERGQPLIPSKETLIKITSGISPDEDETTIEINELRRKILFNRWNDSLTKFITERTYAILFRFQSENTFSGPMRFAIITINEMPDLPDEKYATENIGYLKNFYNNCSERDGKMMTLKAILKTAYSITDSATRDDTFNFFFRESIEFNESEIEEFNNFLTKIDTELPKELISKGLGVIKNPQTTDESRRIVFKIVLGLISQISKEKRTLYLNELIALLDNEEPSIRNFTTSYFSSIEKLSSRQDFKVALNNVTRNICNKKPSEILDYKTSLDTTLEYPRLWGDKEWEDLAGLIKRMLDLNTPEEVRKYARDIIRKFPKILEKYEKDLKTFEKLGDVHGMAKTYGNLGSIYADKGEWDKAIDYYENTLKTFEKLGDVHGMANTLNNLGLVYADKGEWDKAIEAHKRSLEISKKFNDEFGMAQTYGNLGVIFKKIDKLEDSEKFLFSSLEILQRLNAKHEVQIILDQILDLIEEYKKNKENGKAEEISKKLGLDKKN